ncbi:hypothetical protein IX51_01735 [uncultured archaeon]|nr:hypothetical protein IX51_01735 [uncultured archaeon]
MRGARLLLDSLARRGVDTVFGIPGGASLSIYEEMSSMDLRHILGRHEGSTVFMADGFSRVSRKPGVFLGTSGPGATNAVTGVATAYTDSSPVICITGQVATQSMGRDAFQEADSFNLMVPVTKWNFKLKHGAEIPRVINRAFRIATSGRFGPVAIDVPSDVVSKEVDEASIQWADEPSLANSSDLSELANAVSMIRNAAKPAIIAGGGVRWSDSGDVVIRLAEKIGAPVVTTVMGKGGIPEDHPLALGTTGMHGRRSSHWVLNEADLVIAVGTRFSDRTTGKTSGFLPNAKVIHIDIDRAEIGKNITGVVGLAGNSADVLNAIMSGLDYQAESRSEWVKKVSEVRTFCQCDFDLPGNPIKPQKLMSSLSRLLPDDAILTTDVGQHQMFASHFFETRGRRQFITSGGLGTMGFGFPAAVGAKIAAPERKVVSIVGDGGFQMSYSEFITAVENEVPVFTVIMNNQSLGMVRQFQKQFYGNRVYAADYRRSPDFAKFAEAMGGEGVTVEKASEINEAIARGLKSDVPFIADVRVDINEDILPMTPPWMGQEGTIYGRCKWRDVKVEEPQNIGN